MKLDPTNNNREIETDFLKIHGNCMEFKSTVVQLNNISLLSTEDIAAAKFPTAALLVAILGLIVMFLHFSYAVLLGLAMLAGGGTVVYLWYKSVQRAKEMKRLVIITNSGNLFTIVFQDRAFLERVVSVLKEVIANPGHLSDVTINVKENTFTGGSSVIHDYQELHL